MSFNRLKFDTCETIKHNQESTDVGKYMFNTPIITTMKYNTNPAIINQKMGDSMNKNVDWRFYSGPVDVESNLFNITKQASRCPDKKYKPNCQENSCQNQGTPCGDGVSEKCTNAPTKWNRPEDFNLRNFETFNFETNDTRLTNPPSTLRGSGWNRFEILCKNPQNHVFFEGNANNSTRLLFKDNHRPNVVAPRVNDMNPYMKAPKPVMTVPVAAVPNDVLYQYDVKG